MLLRNENWRLISMLGRRSTEDVSTTNNSGSFKGLERVLVEHDRSTTHFKNGDTNGKKLRILVPNKNTFHEFVKVDRDPKGNESIASGYSIDVFKEVMDSLRISYEFVPYENGHSLDLGHYDELILQMKLNGYDGVVGDLTITSNRSKYGDFTLPYMISGISMIVPTVDNHTRSLWWFLKPFTWDLWLLIIALFFANAFVVWILEHKNNSEFQGTFSEEVGKTLSFFFSIFVSAEKEKLKNNYSRLVVNLWIFAVFESLTTYAGILQSMLSDNNDGPIVTKIEQLIMNGDCVGYQKGSFVFDLLKQKGFQEQKLKPYSSVEEYATALSRGSCNDGVSAIIDENPYIKVFFAKYADRYTMVGLPTFRSDGFGFLFQRGAGIVPDVSRAVLKFTQGEKMPELEKKWFGSHEPNLSPPQTPQRDTRMSIYDFRGVFLITEPITFVALVIFLASKILEYWENRGVDASNPVESSNRASNTEANNSHGEIVKGGSDQTPPNGSPLEVEATQNDSSNSEIAFQERFDPSDGASNFQGVQLWF